MPARKKVAGSGPDPMAKFLQFPQKPVVTGGAPDPAAPVAGGDAGPSAAGTSGVATRRSPQQGATEAGRKQGTTAGRGGDRNPAAAPAAAGQDNDAARKQAARGVQSPQKPVVTGAAPDPAAAAPAGGRDAAGPSAAGTSGVANRSPQQGEAEAGHDRGTPAGRGGDQKPAAAPAAAGKDNDATPGAAAPGGGQRLDAPVGLLAAKPADKRSKKVREQQNVGPENELSKRLSDDGSPMNAVMPHAVDPNAALLEQTGTSVLFNPANVLKDDVTKSGSLEGKTILKEGTLSKRVESSGKTEWCKRWVSLCTDSMLISHNKGDTIKDVITLLEIGEIQVWNHSHQKDLAGGTGGGDASSKQADDRKGPLGKQMSRRELAQHSQKMAMGLVKTHGGVLTDPASSSSMEGLEWENSVSISLPFQRRVFHLKTATAEECDEWVDQLRQARAEAFREYAISLELSAHAKVRLAVLRTYEHRFTQWFIASVLLLNFLVNILEAERARDETKEAKQVFTHLDLVFTIFYSAELAVHMYSRWFWSFFRDAWCVFDFIIVTASIIDIIILEVMDNTGGEEESNGLGINVLRMIRIFRVIRVLNKFERMQRVVLAITYSVKSVLNIFVLLWICTSIWAILGVNLYSHETDYFQSFSMASYTLLQVVTMDSWTSITRTFRVDELGRPDIGVVFFFASYVISIGIILLNVVVAILLEGFVKAVEKREQENLLEEERAEQSRVAGPLDPLLSTLANFTSQSHLNSQIRTLFDLLDVDNGGSITYEEMYAGCVKLGYQPALDVTREDWDGGLTWNGALVDAEGALGLESFETAIRWQLILYAQRLMSHKMRHSVKHDPKYATVFFVLKLALMQHFSPSDSNKTSHEVGTSEKNRVAGESHPEEAAGIHGGHDQGSVEVTQQRKIFAEEDGGNLPDDVKARMSTDDRATLALARAAYIAAERSREAAASALENLENTVRRKYSSDKVERAREESAVEQEEAKELKDGRSDRLAERDGGGAGQSRGIPAKTVENLGGKGQILESVQHATNNLLAPKHRPVESVEGIQLRLKSDQVAAKEEKRAAAAEAEEAAEAKPKSEEVTAKEEKRAAAAKATESAVAEPKTEEVAAKEAAVVEATVQDKGTGGRSANVAMSEETEKGTCTEAPSHDGVSSVIKKWETLQAEQAGTGAGNTASIDGGEFQQQGLTNVNLNMPKQASVFAERLAQASGHLGPRGEGGGFARESIEPVSSTVPPRELSPPKRCLPKAGVEETESSHRVLDFEGVGGPAQSAPGHVEEASRTSSVKSASRSPSWSAGDDAVETGDEIDMLVNILTPPRDDSGDRSHTHVSAKEPSKDLAQTARTRGDGDDKDVGRSIGRGGGVKFRSENGPGGAGAAARGRTGSGSGGSDVAGGAMPLINMRSWNLSRPSLAASSDSSSSEESPRRSPMSDKKGMNRQEDTRIRKEQEQEKNQEQEQEQELSSSSIFCQDPDELPVDFGIAESFEA